MSIVRTRGIIFSLFRSRKSCCAHKSRYNSGLEASRTILLQILTIAVGGSHKSMGVVMYGPPPPREEAKQFFFHLSNTQGLNPGGGGYLPTYPPLFVSGDQETKSSIYIRIQSSWLDSRILSFLWSGNSKGRLVNS